MENYYILMPHPIHALAIRLNALATTDAIIPVLHWIMSWHPKLPCTWISTNPKFKTFCSSCLLLQCEYKNHLTVCKNCALQYSLALIQDHIHLPLHLPLCSPTNTIITQPVRARHPRHLTMSIHLFLGQILLHFFNDLQSFVRVLTLFVRCDMSSYGV